jgi:hypothetical protein
MGNFENMSKELLKGGKGNEIKKIVNSPDSQKISKMVDGNALKKAVSDGDNDTVNRIMSQFLSTDEGKALAKKIGERFGNK